MTMIKTVFNFFNKEFSDWNGQIQANNSKYDPLEEIKSQIAAKTHQGIIYRKTFVDIKILRQMNISPNEFYWEKPETDLVQMYQTIQAATEMGYYFTIVTPTPWKRVLLIDLNQIPIRFIKNEWSNNQDWSVN